MAGAGLGRARERLIVDVQPSWFVVATEDGAIDPKLLRKTAARIGAQTTEIKGSHVVFLSQPEAVANVIDNAAETTANKSR